MYEFDEESWFDEDWEQSFTDAGDANVVIDGWLIQSTEHAVNKDRRLKQPSSRVESGTAPDDLDEPQFLQIGTGQWCAAKYATLFPIPSAAEVYAKEFGYIVDFHVKVVKHRF
jgi:hypothetical protein